MNEIKLLIWDLDDTFWKGTLSEEQIEPIQDNIRIVKTLVNRGIMNSIASKNDFESAKNALVSIDNIFEMFIFPKITWKNKGYSVKTIIEECNLRSKNVAFVDDNTINIEEVKFYNPGVTCLFPHELKGILEDPKFVGKDDLNHERLKQYKILEKKATEKKEYISDTDFLKNSEIRVDIRYDCLNHVDRIFELIHRTNQLNYTKIRSSRDELIKILMCDKYKNGYVVVNDKYGEYGIVGFFSSTDEELVHFLFSCRTMGMGIEQYVYQILKFPKINVAEPIAYSLREENVVNWITKSKIESKNVNDIQKGAKVLFVGGCDLSQLSDFISNEGFDVKYEFNTVIAGQEYRTSDTVQLVNALKLDEDIKSELCEKIPFFHKDITFSTSMYDDKNDVVVYSVVDDYIRGIYKNSNNVLIGYAGYFDQDIWISKYKEEDVSYLKSCFEFIGRLPVEIYEKNLEYILSHIPTKTKIVLINGAEVSDAPVSMDRIERNKEMNAATDRVIKNFDNVYLLDMRNMVENKFELNGDNRHYVRSVYFKMAKNLVSILTELGVTSKAKELISKSEKDNIVERFSYLQNSKICIYGTGVRAEKLIFSLSEFNIKGILDKERVDGEFWGYSVIDWNEVERLDVDNIIVAADKKYINEIIDRITPFTEPLNMNVHIYSD